MSLQKPIIVALAFLAMGIATVASAQPPDRGDTPGLGFGFGFGEDHHHTSVGAPGPIAGAGLPLAALVGGGYLWLRRRNRREKA